MKPAFYNPFKIVNQAALAFKPPKRISVAQAASEILYIQQPGGYSGLWSAEETPYMIQPMDFLSSRTHEAVCFVGPSRSGKTMGLLEGWLSYAIECDPGDMLIVQMSQDKARDYSKTRIDRAIRHSPLLRKKITKSQDDNTHDKLFNHGMWLKIGWPTANQLSSSDFRYVALTDYDRMPDNIDGEGAAFQLGLKRTQTFLSRGMCLVESSPGRDISDPHFIPATAHEAPPTNGCLGIYNRSDRRRWYWPCPDCGEFFQAIPGLELFKLLPDYDDLLEVVRKEDLKKFSTHAAKIACPNCSALIEQKHKHQMNQNGVWVPDGQYFDNGRLEGEAIRSNIAGFWLGGCSASYQNWESLLLRYLQGLREYALTGSEETLKSTVNTDQGMPYMPRSIFESGGDSNIKNKLEDYERYHVPEWTRLLLASVDVQGGKNGRFVVQVHAIGELLRQCIVDRFDIAYAGDDATKRRVNPGAVSEDWDLLISRVINSSYKTPEGKKMLIYMTCIDTGGEGDTTNQAYQFYRRLRQQGLANKVRLFKGRSTKSKDPVIQSYGLDDRGAKMRDVPIYLIDTSYFKDIVASILRKLEPSGIFLHLPNWLSNDVIDELQAEIKDDKGRWIKIRQRNETLDLTVYILALCWHLKLNREGFRWDSPMPWCAPLDQNINVVSAEYAREARQPIQQVSHNKQTSKLFSSEWGGRL